MSGKAPPKGPRALLGAHPPPPPPSVHHPNHPPPQLPRPAPAPTPQHPGSRIGATPPTGPRSLLAAAPRPPPGNKPPYGPQAGRAPPPVVGRASWQAGAGAGRDGERAGSPQPQAQQQQQQHGELKQDRASVHIAIQPRVLDRVELPPPPPSLLTTTTQPPQPTAQPPPPPPPPPPSQPPPSPPPPPPTQPPASPPPPPPTIEPPPPPPSPPPSIQPPPPPPTTQPPPPPPPPPEKQPSPPRTPFLPPPPPSEAPPPPPPTASPPPPPPVDQKSAASPLPPSPSPPPPPPSQQHQHQDRHQQHQQQQQIPLPPRREASAPLPPRPSPPTAWTPPPPPRAPSPVRDLSLPRRPSSPAAWKTRTHSREPRHRARAASPPPRQSSPPHHHHHPPQHRHPSPQHRHPSPPPHRAPSPPPAPKHPPPARPAWPPPPAALAHATTYKVLYDPALDAPAGASASAYPPPLVYPQTRSGAYYRQLIEHLRAHAEPGVLADRVRGKGRGREVLVRTAGGVSAVVGPEGFREDVPVVRDPRGERGVRRPVVLRGGRAEFVLVPEYTYDENSTGPPPPTAVLVTGISPLTPTAALRRAFSSYGALLAFEPQIDPATGSALGVLHLKYPSHAEAKRCVEREHGRRGGLLRTAGVHITGGGAGEEEWRVVFDGDGGRLRGVLREVEERKKREREEKRRGAMTPATGTASTSARDASGTPYGDSPAPARKPAPAAGGANAPAGSSASSSTKTPATTAPALPAPPSTLPAKPALPPKPTADGAKGPEAPTPDEAALALERARAVARLRTQRRPRGPASTAGVGAVGSGAAGVRGRPLVKYDAFADEGAGVRSRSASPAVGGGGRAGKSAEERLRDREAVLRALAQNGFDHVQVQGSAQLVAGVQEADVRAFFDGFVVDQVLRDHAALYITFPKAGPAHRATALLGSKQLAMQSVTLTVHPPPLPPRAAAPTAWTQEALAAAAQAALIAELRARLARDVAERLLGHELKRLVVEARGVWDTRGVGVGVGAGTKERKGLKGLSFRKKAAEKAAEKAEEREVVAQEEEEVEEEVGARPVKRRRVVAPEEEEEEEEPGVESEDEDAADVARALALAAAALDRKRTASAEREDEGPARKKLKAPEKVVKPKPAKKGRRGAARVVEVRVVPEEEEAVPSRSPTPVRAPSPPLDPLASGLCADDEDVYFARLALAGGAPPAPEPQTAAVQAEGPAFRTHATGSARTEGFYRITHAEKAAYVAQYQARAATAPAPAVDAAPAQHVASSRSNRATARRRAQGLEEMNQVQRAVALSRGDGGAGELSFKFNQLQTRKKHLRFARSPIHDWGLYAMERVARGEMVIEYVGEVVRAQVADKREKAYERQGIGSSYLFRIDEDLVVDATKKGNLGRLINHSCDPNCTAKIITISGEKKIVIYAKQDIELGDEITYDYHFPFEQDKIPCLCGSAKCRGFLN